jgi:predicted dehydrogenase
MSGKGNREGLRAVMNTQQRIRVGLVGFGYWGPNLARNFQSNHSTELVAICDSNDRRRQLAAALHPTVDILTDFDQLVDRKDIEAIAIATPTGSHYALAKKCLLKGKHVFVEKPLTDSSHSARELVELAERHGLCLHVDHTFVYTGAVQYLREQIQEGLLGELLYFDSTRVNLGLFQPDVNVLWDLAVHDLSILQYVTQRRAIAVSATGTKHPKASHESAAFMTLFYDDNFVAHIDVSWLSPVKIRKTLVSGSKKMVVFDDLESLEKLKIYDSGVEMTDDPDKIRDVLVSYRTGDMVSPKISSHEALEYEVDHFAEVVRMGLTSATDGRLGLELVTVLEAASASLLKRGAPIDIMR